MAKPKVNHRKCYVCKKRGPYKDIGLRAVCYSDECFDEIIQIGIKDAQKAKEKQWKKEKKEFKEKSKGLRDYDKEAQIEFNRWVRTVRDKDDPCISCGKAVHKESFVTGTGWDADHYLSRGAHRELRFHEDNNHKQCVYCNRNLSGNHANYRKRLINKIGIERVEWLEGPHELHKFTIEELQEITKKYKVLIKEAKKNENN